MSRSKPLVVDMAMPPCFRLKSSSKNKNNPHGPSFLAKSKTKALQDLFKPYPEPHSGALKGGNSTSRPYKVGRKLTNSSLKSSPNRFLTSLGKQVDHRGNEDLRMVRSSMELKLVPTDATSSPDHRVLARQKGSTDEMG